MIYTEQNVQTNWGTKKLKERMSFILILNVLLLEAGSTCFKRALVIKHAMKTKAIHLINTQNDFPMIHVPKIA